MERRRITSGSPWEPTVGFSRAYRVGDTCTSPAPDPSSRTAAAPPTPTAQAMRCFDIIEAALRDAGASLDDVVRTRMYVTDPAVMDAVGAAHQAAVGHVRPAATMVVVAGLADERWLVEIEAEAVVG
jgi:enamine deaminase RidA (YjgF/YER057c/UK114 family)